MLEGPPSHGCISPQVAATILPQLTHAVVGGESLQILLVELSTMQARDRSEKWGVIGRDLGEI